MKLNTILSVAAFAFAPRAFHAAPDDAKTGGDGIETHPVTRPRQPLGELEPGTIDQRRMRQAKAAAKTLAEQEDARALKAKNANQPYERKPTPTAEELYKEAAERDASGVRQPDPLPLKGPGEIVNGIYVPTIEEVKAAGYSHPEAVRNRVLTEAQNANTQRGLVAPVDLIPKPNLGGDTQAPATAEPPKAEKAPENPNPTGDGTTPTNA